MKRVLFIACCLFCSVCYAQKPAWVATKLFQRDVFIENKGQFSAKEQALVGDKILFSAHKGNLFLYFSKSSITFRYDSVYNTPKDGEEAEPENTKVKHILMKMSWDGANKNTQVEALNQADDYFTYGNPNDKTGKTAIKAHGFARLYYHNLYPGIDAVFYYSGEGLKYNVIVHPGADISSVKMHYSSNALLSFLKNELHISFSGITIVDHAPTALDENSNKINVSFSLNKNTASFVLGNYDKRLRVDIDPWYTSLSFSTINKAYDLGYDLQGNVYVYGGQNTFQLQKYNSTGVLQWTYTASFAYHFALLFNFYGDVTVDSRSGTSYLSEGYDSAGAQVLKINSAGIQQNLFQGKDYVTEFWRMNFDDCDNKLVIGAGNTTSSGVQACTLDTNFTRLDTADILGTTEGAHDMTLLGLDGHGKCYMATAHNYLNYDTSFNNLLCSLPLPTLKPTAYQVYDKYHFNEISSIKYYPHYGGGLTPYSAGNGFNGLAANSGMVLTYDGATLRKWRPSGFLADSLHISAVPMAWGGLELDCGGNIYVGNAMSVNVYDSSLNLLTTLALPDTVFDLAVGINQQVYACGNGYATSVTSPSITNITSASFTYPSTCTSCDGTAKANPACGTPPYTYYWSNGATTQTITGLCAGLYTVTVTDGTCPPWEDTAMVSIPGEPGYSASLTDTNPNCHKLGSITAFPTGGTPPYTYHWSNGETNQKDTGLVAGTYTLTLIDASGCHYFISTTLTQHIPLVTTSPKNDNLCLGQGLNLTASGAGTYMWAPPTGLSCTNCANPIASPTVSTTYTVTGADSNGCTSSATVAITVHPNNGITIVPANDTICQGTSAILTAFGGINNYAWSPSTSLSCDFCSVTLARPASTTTYTITGTDIWGCQDTVKYTLGVTPKPIGTVSPPAKICKGDSVTLNAGGGTSYVWSTGATGSSITVSPAIATSYTVAVKKGCVDSLITDVGFYTPPGTVCCSQVIFIGNSAQLSVTNASAGSTYSWFPATGLSCTTCPDPAASPTVNTTYYVTITDNQGCTKTDSVTIDTRIKCKDPFVPNAFSPNNDGQNDVLYVRGNCLVSMHFEIYDRWGNKVFETENINEGWNGDYNGRHMNTGDYVYYLKATNSDGGVVVEKGTVALIR